MLGRTLLIIAIACTFVQVDTKAGELILNGMYQGKNLYVQNPFASNMKDFCTSEVFVNDKLVSSNLRTSAYEIDLSHLKLNDPVVVRIAHKDDCEPKIINPQVIRVQTNFQFLSSTADDNYLYWSTKGEKPNGKYFIEQFINNKWIIISTINNKGETDLNQYTVSSNHNSGNNKYRIKLLQQDGLIFYSKEINFVSNEEPVTFFPTRVNDKITLSRETTYEVLDAYGNQITKGKGKEIMLKELTSGLYYLNIDNRTEKFIKK
jgi:hypothetical protein